MAHVHVPRYVYFHLVVKSHASSRNVKKGKRKHETHVKEQECINFHGNSMLIITILRDRVYNVEIKDDSSQFYRTNSVTKLQTRVVRPITAVKERERERREKGASRKEFRGQLHNA